jgi:hypothetical protein
MSIRHGRVDKARPKQKTMAWYKQILLAGAISLLMIPAISWFVNACQNRDSYEVAEFKLSPKTPNPEVYKGKIDLTTGDVRIVKN